MFNTKWFAPSGGTRPVLCEGIRKWVAVGTGLQHARFSRLHALTLDDLTLLAMASGYVPSEVERTRIDTAHALWAKQATTAPAGAANVNDKRH